MEAMTEQQQEQQQQQQQQQLQQHTVACLPIVYGSIAFYLGKKADEYQTHEWSLFLRGPNHEDLSPAISKVIFQLHPSFAQPVRELTEPPYEVTERGWGEFEAQIRVHWKDPDEKTTIVNHTIKLYPPGTPPNVLPKDTETPVVAETYDEVVFTDPSELFFKSLRQVPLLPKLEPDTSDKNDQDDQDDGEETTTANKKTKSGGVQQPETRHPKNWKDHLNIVYSDQQDFLTLLAAQKFLQEELSKVKQRFQIVNDDTIAVDQKMIVAQQQKHREAAAAVAVAGSTTTTAAGGAASASSSAATTANAKFATATTKTTTSGKKTKTPSGQRKQRPSSQTKKAKTAITPVPTSSSSSAAVGGTAAATATAPPQSAAAAAAATKTTTTAVAAAAGNKGQPPATTSTKPAGPGKTVVTTKK
jgi:YEATS domain-containing protein 4